MRPRPSTTQSASLRALARTSLRSNAEYDDRMGPQHSVEAGPIGHQGDRP
jgi:hypothetical protein